VAHVLAPGEHAALDAFLGGVLLEVSPSPAG
jgi:hypothetical protein